MIYKRWPRICDILIQYRIKISEGRSKVVAMIGQVEIVINEGICLWEAEFVYGRITGIWKKI